MEFFNSGHLTVSLGENMIEYLSWDGAVYHFNHIRKTVFCMVESDSLNHTFMGLKMMLVHCFPQCLIQVVFWKQLEIVFSRRARREWLCFWARVLSQVNGIEQICRCLGEKSNAPNLCHKPPRLLNYAIYDKMTCMLHRYLLAVTIAYKRIFKIQIRNMFFCFVFDVAASCTVTSNMLQASGHSYATLQCVGILLTLDVIQVTWPFDV